MRKDRQMLNSQHSAGQEQREGETSAAHQQEDLRHHDAVTALLHIVTLVKGDIYDEMRHNDEKDEQDIQVTVRCVSGLQGVVHFAWERH
jgi:hypothetical protein